MLTVPSNPNDDVVAFITVKLRSNGSMSTEGHIGDESFAIAMLENAKDAIRSQHAKSAQIIVPARDVDVRPGSNITRAIGDMAPADRGDLPP